MVTGNSEGFCTKQKADKILWRFTILLYYQHKDASLEIIQCAKPGACGIGWPPSPIADTSGGFDKS